MSLPYIMPNLSKFKTDCSSSYKSPRIINYTDSKGNIKFMLWDGLDCNRKSFVTSKKLPTKVSSLRQQMQGERETVEYDSKFVAILKTSIAVFLSLSLGIGFIKLFFKFFFVLGFMTGTFLLSLSAGITILGAFWLISSYFLPISRKLKIKERIKLSLPTDLDEKEFVRKLTEAEQKVKQLQNFNMDWATNSQMRIFKDEIDKVCILASKLIDELVDKPQHILAARNHIGYYLDATISILDQYKNMKDSDDKTEMKKRINKILEDVHHALDSKLSKLDKQDTTELDIDIKLLENELKQDYNAQR